MKYVVMYLDRNGHVALWTLVVAREDRDEALKVLDEERVAHPDREYRMEICSINVFDVIFMAGWEMSDVV
jgi:hypothetical protein